jgi:hypothetical protein
MIEIHHHIERQPISQLLWDILSKCLACCDSCRHFVGRYVFRSPISGNIVDNKSVHSESLCDIKDSMKPIIAGGDISPVVFTNTTQFPLDLVAVTKNAFYR